MCCLGINRVGSLDAASEMMTDPPPSSRSEPPFGLVSLAITNASRIVATRRAV